MRLKTRILGAAIVCLILVSSIFALCACNASQPKLDRNHLEGWSICFKGSYIKSENGAKEVSYNLSEYIDKNEPITVRYRGGGHYINIDYDVRYQGKVQKDIWIHWTVLPRYKPEGATEWTSMMGANIPIKDKGEYSFSNCLLAHKDKFLIDDNGVGINGGLSFNLFIIVV